MRPAGAPTLKDVARAAGVSVMTVSNVVNDRPRVGPETRARVLDAIADLGYEVNLTARRLRAGRSGTIAFVVPRVDHPYFGQLGAQLTTALRASDRHLVIEQTNASKEGELGALSQARLQMYDGVLLSVVGLAPDDVDRLQTQLPLVLLGERPMPPRFDHVMLGNVEGARLATAHLLARGARRVAIVGGTLDDEVLASDDRAVTGDVPAIRERLAGDGAVRQVALTTPVTPLRVEPDDRVGAVLQILCADVDVGDRDDRRMASLVVELVPAVVDDRRPFGLERQRPQKIAEASRRHGHSLESSRRRTEPAVEPVARSTRSRPPRVDGRDWSERALRCSRAHRDRKRGRRRCRCGGLRRRSWSWSRSPSLRRGARRDHGEKQDGSETHVSSRSTPGPAGGYSGASFRVHVGPSVEAPES